MRKQCVPGLSSGGRGLGTRLSSSVIFLLNVYNFLRQTKTLSLAETVYMQFPFQVGAYKMLLTSKIEILDEVYTYKLTKPILFWGGSRNKTNFTVLYLPNLVGKVRSSRICL